MDILNHQTAASYVAKIEASWGESGIVTSIADSNEGGPDCPAIDVATESNRWTVWVECGALYGEC